MILVMPFVGDFFARDLLPNGLAGFSVIADNHELIRLARRFGAWRATFLARAGVGFLRHGGSDNIPRSLFGGGDGSQNENPVSPNNGSGAAGTRHASFP